MDELVTTLVIVAFTGVTLFAARAHSRKARDEVMRSFNAQTFDTPVGRVTAEALKVVKISRQPMQLGGDDLSTLGQQDQPSDAFLYCVGPGPSYFVAIAIAQTTLAVPNISSTQPRSRSFKAHATLRTVRENRSLRCSVAQIANVRFWPIADVRPDEPAVAMLMSAFDPRGSFMCA